MGDVMSLDKLDKVKADTEEIKNLIEGIDGDVTIINGKVDALEDAFCRKSKCNWTRVLKICYCSVC